jgi:hypothetical protein
MDEANEAYEERLEAARAKRLRQEATDRADAERYRWLRGDGGPTSVRWPRWMVQHWTGHWNPVQGNEMDAAIDAAMRHDQDA